MSPASTPSFQKNRRLAVGIVLGLVVPSAGAVGILGDLFVGALKALAPLLVFFLVMNALARHKKGSRSNIGTVIVLYLVGTFLAALCAVVASYLFPSVLTKEHEKSPKGNQSAAFGGFLLHLSAYGKRYR